MLRRLATAAALAVTLTGSVPARAIDWSVTGSTNVARDPHVAVLLADGRVLVASDQTAEAYDVGSGMWSYVAAPKQSIDGQTGITLDSGLVLFAGGKIMITMYQPLANAQLFDPTANSWSVLPKLHVARAQPSVLKLMNGHVLVIGGSVGAALFDQTPSVESFDPVAKTWTALDDMTFARLAPGQAELEDGRIIVFGGEGHNAMNPNDPKVPLDNTEVLTGEASLWAAGIPLTVARFGPRFAVLHDGRILAAGGTGAQDLASAELYDLTTKQWAMTGAMSTSRFGGASTLLRGGCMLMSGGENSVALASTELYDPKTETWTPGPDMPAARKYHNATLLEDGRVIVTGGQNSANQATAITWLLTLTADAASCSGNCECLSGACLNGSCCSTTKSPGDVCKNDCECLSGNCVDGVCCESICDGPCQACGKTGKCEPVNSGPDPNHKCVDEGASTCGLTGKCEAGKCEKYPDGTECAPLTCKDGHISKAECNGSGQCVNDPIDCTPYGCNPDGTCKPKCQNIHDCANGFVCTSNHECIPSPQNKPPDEFGGCCGVAGRGPDEPWFFGLLPAAAALAFARRRARRA